MWLDRSCACFVMRKLVEDRSAQSVTRYSIWEMILLVAMARRLCGKPWRMRSILDRERKGWSDMMSSFGQSKVCHIDNFCKCPRIQSLVWELCSKSDFCLGSGGKNDQSGTTLHYGRGNTHWRHCVGWAGASWESRMLNCIHNGHSTPATDAMTKREHGSTDTCGHTSCKRLRRLTPCLWLVVDNKHALSVRP